MVNAINKRDYGVVQGSVIVSSLAFCIIMLVVDVVYAYVDPRIKARYESRTRRKKHAD